MAKLPLPARQTKAVLLAAATAVGPQVVEYLRREGTKWVQDPDRARQLQELLARLDTAAKRRTPEGRLEAKIDALRAHVDGTRPGDLAPKRVDAWRRRLDALDGKRTLIVNASSGRQRGKQLKQVSKQVDDLITEFLDEADETIGA